MLGRAFDIDGNALTLKPNLMEAIHFADKKSTTFKEAIDAYILKEGIAAPPSAPDPGEPALPDLNGSDRIDKLDLRKAGITSVIWCTGFDADWDWLKVDVFDDRGHPKHRNGIAELPGIYFIGFPWLSKRKSGTLYGIAEDAGRIVQHIRDFLGHNL